MPEAHALVEAVAAGVLIVAGGAAIVALFRGRHTPIDTPLLGGPEAPAPRSETIGWSMLAAASLGAAIIHAAVAPEHLEEWGAAGSIFLVAAAMQAIWAAMAVGRRSRRIAGLGVGATGIAINAAILAVWAISRTVGFPPGNVEDVGRPDIAAGLLEAAIVVGLLGRRTGARITDVVQDRVAATAAIAWVPVVGVVLLVTVLGLAGGEPHLHH